jgi:general stress protein YciG
LHPKNILSTVINTFSIAVTHCCNKYDQQHEEKYMTQHRGGSGNFAEDRQRASDAGQKGGQHSSGNFKNDPQRASEAGQKGGQQSGGNFKNDRERASEAGRKGGENSHGGGRS